MLTIPKIIPPMLSVSKLKYILPRGGSLACDIDATLVDTPYFLISKGIEEFGTVDGMSARELIDCFRYFQHIPWDQDDKVSLVNKWCYDSDSQKDIPLFTDASDAIWKINQIIPIGLYHTARPPIVYPGTYEWLMTTELPKVPVRLSTPEGADLFTDRNKYKAMELIALQNEVFGIIDDNAGLLKYLPYNYPGWIFVYNSSETFAHPRAIACPNWEAVVEAIQNIFG